MRSTTAMIPLGVLVGLTTGLNVYAQQWPQYPDNPFIIKLDIPAPKDHHDSAGGIVVADLNADGLLDYLVTVEGHLAAYGHMGRKLWIVRAPMCLGFPSDHGGLPGHHAPGVQAGDIDGDGRCEVVFFTRGGVLHVLDGPSGREEWQARPPRPKGARPWEHAVIANLRGRGDADLLIQATNADGYWRGRYVAAYAIEHLRRGDMHPLWERDDFVSCYHNGARVADLNADGRDEILGGTILSPEGRLLCRAPVRGHLDSIFVADILPNRPGLEVVSLEEGGGNRVFCYDDRGLIWISHNRHQEPQNAALGEFDLNRPGLEIWCRSRYNEHQKPWTFDAFGKLIRQYEMDDVAPEGWTVRGVEVIYTIDWTGQRKQLAAAKERHRAGDVCIFDPISGRFILRLHEHADRLYVADVSGDWREEIIALNRSELHIYHNDSPNPRPNEPRLWRLQYYRRCKMTYNYYSP